jgi:hypothetical protein
MIGLVMQFPKSPDPSPSFPVDLHFLILENFIEEEYVASVTPDDSITFAHTSCIFRQN